MKTALHSVSYAGVWRGQARLDLPDFFRRAASLGYDGVMLMAKRPHLSVLDASPDARQRWRNQLGELGLKVACLAGYNDFALGHARPELPTREMQLLYIRELCQLAADLGSSLVRVFTAYSDPAVSFDDSWSWCVESLRECAKMAADRGVTIGVQNHHDTAVHWQSTIDLLEDIDHPNCRAMFDAWAPALQGCDIVEAATALAQWTVHTTVADYVRRPRFTYVPQLVTYLPASEVVRAVPMGEGFIDYRGFLRALRQGGYSGYVAYEMCSPLRGGGSVENLDRCARTFLDYMKTV